MPNELAINENQDILYSGFVLSRTGLRAIGEPSFGDWERVGEFIKKAEGAVHFWIGDWLNYGETHYGETYSQAIDSTGYDYQTLANDKWLSKNIELSDRSENLGVRHAQIIASLPEEDKKYWAKEIKNEHVTVKELREKVKKRRASLLPQPEIPTGKFSVIYVDPPWDVDAGPEWGSGLESRDLIYPTMTIEQIMKLPIGDLSERDAHLYIWTINKYIPETYMIAKEWGFDPSCLLTWAKPPHGIGLGGTFVQTTEHLLFCRKGNLSANKRIDTTWFQYPRGRHSEKPDEFRRMIEEVSPGKRIELFAREKIRDWEVWGNEV